MKYQDQWTEKHEKAAQKLLKKWQQSDPFFFQKQEFGKLLMKNINDFTPEEMKRYEELKKLLMPNMPDQT